MKTKSFDELKIGDKILVVDMSGQLHERVIEDINKQAGLVEISTETGDKFSIYHSDKCYVKIARASMYNDTVLVFVGTNKNELIDSYVENLEHLIENTRKKVNEGLNDMVNMQDKIDKIKEYYD